MRSYFQAEGTASEKGLGSAKSIVSGVEWVERIKRDKVREVRQGGGGVAIFMP